jgi:hypothetical protein
MAELRAAHTASRLDGHNCQPNGLAHGFEYANKLHASCKKTKIEKSVKILFFPSEFEFVTSYVEHFLIGLVDTVLLFQFLSHLEQFTAELQHSFHA